MLARKAVDSVKDAELRSDKILEGAQKKSEEIIQNALTEAQNYSKLCEKEAVSKAKLIIGIANSQAKKKVQESSEAVDKELVLLENLVKSKRKEAVTLILEQVI